MRVEISNPEKVTLDSAVKYDDNIYVLLFETASKYCNVSFGGGYNPEVGNYESVIFKPEYVGYDHPLAGTINLMDISEFPVKRIGEFLELQNNHPDCWQSEVCFFDTGFEIPTIQWCNPMKHAYEIGIVDLTFADKPKNTFNINTQEYGKYQLTEGENE